MDIYKKDRKMLIRSAYNELRLVHDFLILLDFLLKADIRRLYLTGSGPLVLKLPLDGYGTLFIRPNWFYLF